MISKQRLVSGRTRVTPRLERRAPGAAVTEDARLAEARRVACRFVAARWPELAGVAPVMTARCATTLNPETLERLGLSRADLVALERDDEYTFTFAGEGRTADNTTTPLVANVTVDPGYRIVKTSVSR